MTAMDDYEEGDTILLLLRGVHAATVMREWWEANRACDLRWRRAKTPGHVALETTDLMFAASVVALYRRDIRISIRKKQC